MNKRYRFNLLFAAAALVAASPLVCGSEARASTESEAVNIAIARNPALRAALADYESARWSVVSAEGKYAMIFGATAGVTRSAIPSLSPAGGVSTGEAYSADVGASLSQRLVWGTMMALDLGGSWSLNRSAPVAGFGDTTIGPGYGLMARFSIVQPLLRGAGREVGEAEINAALARRSIAELDRDRSATALLESVVNAYWDLWYSRETLDIQRKSLALAQQQRDEAQARVDTGSLAPAEVLSFETRLATRQEDVANAELDRDSRALALQRVLGQPGNAVSPDDDPPTAGDSLADPAQLALAASLEVRQAKAAVALAQVEARTADDSLKPRLDLDAYAEARGLGNKDVAPAFRQLGSLGAVSAHVGLTFETPLSGAQRRAAAARAQLAVQAAQLRLDEAEQTVLANVRTEQQREQTARARVALAERTAEIADKQLQAERDRFATGASTPLSILQAEDDARAAHLRVAKARADLVSSVTALRRLTGSLLGHYSVNLDQKPSRGPTGMFRAPLGSF